MERIRTICLVLPGATSKLSRGAPSFFVKRQFVALWPDGHHGQQFPHLWCAAPPGAQEELVASESHRFFRPPYLGGRGWIGMRVDRDVDDVELAAVRGRLPGRRPQGARRRPRRHAVMTGP